MPANRSVTLPDPVNAPGVTEPTILMQDSGDQSTCTGSFTLNYGGTNTGSGTGTGSGVATFGLSSPFKLAIAPAAGNGLLLPTLLGDHNATVDTVNVTVTNTGSGNENLNQLVYEVTPHLDSHARRSPPTASRPTSRSTATATPTPSPRTTISAREPPRHTASRSR